MSKVTIKRISINTKYGDRFDEIELFVDGQKIGDGFFGGEPEDNTKNRTYWWVEPLMVNLAKQLGAEVEFEDVESDGDE